MAGSVRNARSDSGHSFRMRGFELRFFYIAAA